MLNVRTLIRFFCLDEDAIKQIAASPMATWVGLLFVCSAGLAREYDGEYLVAEPWHLLIPVAASVIGCFSMVTLVYLLAWARKAREHSFWTVFRSFLNVYWMTAPLAWVYGIPVERMFDPANATTANLVFLGIVAAWRVLLMVRCVQVLYRTSFYGAWVPVILFSDILAMTALYWVPAPIIVIMGGIRLTESEQIILSARIWTGLLGYGTMLVWIVSYFVLLAQKTPWQFFLNAKDNTEDKGQTRGVSRGVWGLVVVSILLWCCCFPITQPEQKLRWQAENMLRSDNFAGFSQLSQQYAQNQFPPHWDPPPRIAYREKEPDLRVATSGMLRHSAAEWAVELYLDKIHHSSRGFGAHMEFESFSDDELEEFVSWLESMPNSKEIAAEYRSSATQMVSFLQDKIDSEKRIESLERLLEIAGPE